MCALRFSASMVGLGLPQGLPFAPASPEPIPIVLLPGFEYPVQESLHPETT